MCRAESLEVPVYMVDSAATAEDHLKVVWEREKAQRFGDAVRRLRKEAGLTQEALAQQVGMTKNHIQLLEAGRASSRADGPPSNPRMTTVHALADVLQVRPEDLLTK